MLNLYIDLLTTLVGFIGGVNYFSYLESIASIGRPCSCFLGGSDKGANELFSVDPAIGG